MQRITASQAAALGRLESQLGNRTLRTILTQEDARLVRPERLANLLAGRGRLSPQDVDRLDAATRNTRLLTALKTKAQSQRESKTNRALRDWLASGKAKGVSYKDQDADVKERQLKAIKALRFLGVDPSEGTYYVIQRKA